MGLSYDAIHHFQIEFQEVAAANTTTTLSTNILKLYLFYY